MSENQRIIPAGGQDRIRRAPEDHLIYAIGDIHGRADLLEDLLIRIEEDVAGAPSARHKTLIFLGDYVDRGPDSAGVVEILLDGLPTGFSARFLKGNHEDMLLGFLDGSVTLMAWAQNGGDATLASYGVDPVELDISSAPVEKVRQVFAQALPQTHRVFFDSLELVIEMGDYLFVHAGIRPGRPLDKQDPQDLLWIRDEFGGSGEEFGKMVVHGHTAGREPIVRANRICIDTQAWFSGRLTALRLYGRERELLWT